MSEGGPKEPSLKRIDATGAYAFVHPCSVCGSGAVFGFDVKLRVGRPGKWFCREHKPTGRKSDETDPKRN